MQTVTKARTIKRVVKRAHSPSVVMREVLNMKCSMKNRVMNDAVGQWSIALNINVDTWPLQLDLPCPHAHIRGIAGMIENYTTFLVLSKIRDKKNSKIAKKKMCTHSLNNYILDPA